MNIIQINCTEKMSSDLDIAEIKKNFKYISIKEMSQRDINIENRLPSHYCIKDGIKHYFRIIKEYL